MRKDLMALCEDDLVLLTNRGTVKRCAREIAEGEFTFTYEEDAGNLRFSWSDGVECRLPATASLGSSHCTCPAAGICRHLVRSVMAYQRRSGSTSAAIASPLAASTTTTQEQLSGATHSGSDSDSQGLSSTGADNLAVRPVNPAAAREAEPGGTSVNEGASSTASGSTSVNEGAASAASGSTSVNEGAASAASGSTSVNEGVASAASGSTSVNEGVSSTTSDRTSSSVHESLSPLSSWNPGDISDDELFRQVKPTDLKRARKMFVEGHVVELTTGAKPLARFFTLPVAVRFLVPGDCRYTHCNCLETAPCVHVPLSVFAFRLLRARSAAIVSTNDSQGAVTSAVMEEIESLMIEIACVGVAGLAPAYVGRMQRLKQRCDENSLSWITDLIDELLIERDRYHGGDALFSLENFVEVLAEICMRKDALVANTGVVPRVFVSGSATDRAAGQDSLRLIGLGCGVEYRNKKTTFNAYFQDDTTGYLIGMRKQVVTVEEDNRRFWQLAAGATVRGYSVIDLAAGQLLCKGGKLAVSRLYAPGRSSPLSLNPQSFNWERLRFPVMMERLSELRSILSFQVPAYLGPRYPGRNLYVCGINRLLNVHFSGAHQALIATIIDKAGEKCTLYHPYTARGHDGFESLLNELQSPNIQPLFVAGMFDIRASGLVVRPVSLVVQDGPSRRILQPWVDRPPQTAHKKLPQLSAASPVRFEHPLESFCNSIESLLGEMLASGVDRSSEHTVNAWNHLATEATDLGFVDLSKAVREMHTALESRRHHIDWNATIAAGVVLKLCVLHLVMREIVLDVVAANAEAVTVRSCSEDLC